MNKSGFLPLLLCLLATLIPAAAFSAEPESKDVTVEMTTTEGTVTLLLYGDTPRHLENFVKLAREGYYDGLLFHRVINEFMVQAGDPNSRDAAPGQHLGDGSPDYKIEAEIVYPRHYHKRGALAAAREGDEVNPGRASSGSQFYIVTGRRYTPVELDRLEMKVMRAQREAQANKTAPADMPLGFTPGQIDTYTTKGGAAHLDAQYTVFGEVIAGMDVIERIEKAETDSWKRPVNDIRILSMKVID